MPHCYEFKTSSVARSRVEHHAEWHALQRKPKDSVRCDEVQKLPPERSQRNERVGEPWRNPKENCQDSN